MFLCSDQRTVKNDNILIISPKINIFMSLHSFQAFVIMQTQNDVEGVDPFIYPEFSIAGTQFNVRAEKH